MCKNDAPVGSETVGEAYGAFREGRRHLSCALGDVHAYAVVLLSQHQVPLLLRQAQEAESAAPQAKRLRGQ